MKLGLNSCNLFVDSGKAREVRDSFNELFYKWPVSTDSGAFDMKT